VIMLATGYKRANAAPHTREAPAERNR
jgi:hypothetical protein